MGNHPRIETTEHTSFNTIRCRNAKLWFINNKELEQRILAHTAKYITTRNVDLYAFAIEGDHLHDLADFPLKNRSDYMRDRNSIVGKLVPLYCDSHEGGGTFGRRYSSELIPHHVDDIEERFFYTVLQPVQDGLVPRISDYPGYNCFHDAAWGKKKKYKIVDWTKYKRAKRSNPRVRIKDFETTYVLEYKRIPGYEELTQRQYALMLTKKLEERRGKIVAERLASGQGFVGAEALAKMIPGTSAKNPKTSERHSFRPRVLSVCPFRLAECKEFYFNCLNRFRIASDKYRKGQLDVEFPDGMYRPSCRPPPQVVQ